MNKKQKIILYIIIALNIITTYCNYKITCEINELKEDIDYINSDLLQYQSEEISHDW